MNFQNRLKKNTIIIENHYIIFTTFR